MFFPRQSTIKPGHPNNVVKLASGKIFKISKILKKFSRENELQNIFLLGCEDTVRGKAFDYPINAEDIGIYMIWRFSEHEKLFVQQKWYQNVFY